MIARILIQALVGGSIAAGCGGESASLGNVRPGPDGGNGAGSGNDGATGASGTSGTSGASSATGGVEGSTTNDAAPSCLLPEPPSVSNPTPQELERALLVHDFCMKLGQDGCLNVAGGSSFVGEDSAACSIERRIAACEWDQRSQYSQLVIPACDDEWQAAIRCATGADYPDHARCSVASVFVASQSSETCRSEKAALGTCLGHDSTRSIVAGNRTVCSYGTGATGAACQVSCQVGRDAFESRCDGPSGVPVRCDCWANGHSLLNQSGILVDNSFYASDCREAARYMADATFCTNLLDCCTEYLSDSRPFCHCGSLEQCEVVRRVPGRTPVERCAKYDPF
jgi:hypothetical protein